AAARHSPVGLDGPAVRRRAPGLARRCAPTHDPRRVTRMSAPRILRLYFRLLGTHLRGALEYESDFWIMVFAAVLTQAVNVLFLMAIFRLVPSLHGWTFWP